MLKNMKTHLRAYSCSKNPNIENSLVMSHNCSTKTPCPTGWANSLHVLPCWYRNKSQENWNSWGCGSHWPLQQTSLQTSKPEQVRSQATGKQYQGGVCPPNCLKQNTTEQGWKTDPTIKASVNLCLYIPGDYTYVCCHMAFRALESDRLVVGKDWTADDSVPV